VGVPPGGCGGDVVSRIERTLLTSMTTPEGMAEVVEAGLGAEVFEEPVCRAAFSCAMEYWSTNQMAPTPEVLTTEFPGLKLEAEVEEATSCCASLTVSLAASLPLRRARA
jgi:hypothetical protein